MIRIPAEIESEMKLWRRGLVCLPKSYVEYHRKAASDDLDKNASKRGWTVHSKKMISDGWMDGMTFLSAVIETKDGTLLKIKWSDGHCWYDQCPSGGWGLFCNPSKEQ